MGIVPNSRAEAITWFTNRLAAWTADPASIGLTPESVASLAALTSTASGSLQSAEQIRSQSKGATQTFHTDADAMRDLGTSLVATIKAYAETTSDPSVYVAAEIPEPATPAPTPAPGQPYEFVTQILQNGAIQVRFKCDNPGAKGGTAGGVGYEVLRQDDATGDYGFVTVAGEREFVDATLPAGTARSTYRVTAFRGTQRGALATFNVFFGVGGNGQAVVQQIAPSGVSGQAA